MPRISSIALLSCIILLFCLPADAHDESSTSAGDITTCTYKGTIGYPSIKMCDKACSLNNDCVCVTTGVPSCPYTTWSKVTFYLVVVLVPLAVMAVLAALCCCIWWVCKIVQSSSEQCDHDWERYYQGPHGARTPDSSRPLPIGHA